MPEIAALNLEIRSESVKQATVEVKAFEKSATAADRAAERWGMTNTASARSMDEFSKRVRKTVEALNFESTQLKRSADDREKYSALRRAGVAEASAEGRAILASVSALQAQRAATTESNVAANAGVGLFGQITDKIKGYGAALTVAALATAALAKGKEIEDYALTIDKLAKSFKVSTLEAQALEAASRQTGKSAEDLNEGLSKSQKLLLTQNFKAAFGDTSAILGDVTAASKRLSDAWNDMTEAGHQSMVAMFGDITASVLNALADAIRTWSSAISAAGVVLSRVANSPQIPSVASFIESGQNVSAGIGGGFPTMDAGPVASAMDIVAEKSKNTKDELDRLNGKLADTRAEFDRDGDRGGVLAAEIANLEQRVLSLTGTMIALNNAATGTSLALSPFAGKGINLGPDAFKGAGRDIIKPYIPSASEVARIIAEGATKPVPAGGGGGKTDNDNIDAQIKRYEALGDVAKRAGETISANRAKNIEDLQREVRVQEQVEEIAAKLGAKYSEADAARKQQLHDEIALYEQRKAANQLALESAKKAEDIEVKFGDGTRARAQLERELTLAKDSGRVSTEALTRAEKQRSEDLDQATLAAQRYDDSLGSLAAGYEHAANAAKRSNDLFSQGAQLYDLQKEAFSGFFSDFANGLRQGQSAWDAFGNAATNALNKIADKLLSMAVNNLFDAAFGGGKGGGGGFLSGIFGSIFGSSSSSAAGVQAGITPGGGIGGGVYAKGGVFDHSNVVPFARGGIVTRPTLFPFAKGTGLMGEAGPEAIVPLRRGRGGRLGIEASGGGGGDVIVNIANYTDSTVSAKKSKGSGGQMQVDIIVEAVESKMSGRLSRGQGALGKTMEGTYGLQRKGR